LAARLVPIQSSAPRIHQNVARQDIPCNACGSRENSPYCPANGLDLVKCSQCGLVFVSPRPDAHELYALYGETYFQNDASSTVGYTNYVKDEANIRKTFGGRLRQLEGFVRPGRLLDVGCAAGFFLAEADYRGWDVQGLDVSSFAVEYATQRFGLTVKQGSFTELNYPKAHFDAVTMWDVIEHVPDPLAYIQKAAAVLRPGGILALATPDVDSLPARLTGKRWVGYKLSEEHVYYFSARTLSKLLDKAGFEVVNVRHVGKYVTLRLFLDRLSLYSPTLAKILTVIENRFQLSERSLYMNPFDIVAITAKKR
jgi:2-polyprenyl-3-methyl-5-hydroxy-6-metoxy-1,4-benzoquinol methylase